MEQSKGLDGGTLKLMAAALMLIDHVGAILLPETSRRKVPSSIVWFDLKESRYRSISLDADEISLI